jgi:para-aminobenzoate synthetase component 1
MVIGVGAEDELVADGAEAFAALDRLRSGWWAGWLGYDLGRAVERVPALAAADPGLPDVVLTRFAARAVIGADGVRTTGARGARRVLEAALRRAGEAPRGAGRPTPRAGEGRTPAAAWSTSLGREAFIDAVRDLRDHILAGDCYQVNLTRRLRRPLPADPSSHGPALFAVLAAHHPAPHLGFFRHRRATVVSASPERYLRVEGRLVETRPIKGTGTDPAALARSAKDRAENVMIVDMARNDLGRVCIPGSIRVAGLCRVESHPGLVHLVSTVRGRLGADVGIGDLLRATFPPASVTGAPKPAALALIERLEPVRRGVYCGGLGFVDATAGRADLAVAIRTFVAHGGDLDLGVGAGITADSVPEREWEETELKADRLLALAAAAAGARPVPAACAV